MKPIHTRTTLLAEHDLFQAHSDARTQDIYVNIRETPHRPWHRKRVLRIHMNIGDRTVRARFDSRERSLDFPWTIAAERPDMSREAWLDWIDRFVYAWVNERIDIFDCIVTTSDHDAPMFEARGYTRMNDIPMYRKRVTPTT